MGKSAPDADPRIGEAALKSAETGERYLQFMQGMSDETMQWARDDRSRFEQMFRPLEDRLASEAANYDTPERRAEAAREAVSDVRQQTAIMQGARERNLAAVGVAPGSGRAASEDRRADAGAAMASAGAANLARKQVEATGDAKVANAINVGRGNAASAAGGVGQAAGMSGAGFSGAMSGYGQMGSLLNTQYQQRLQSWQANNSMWGGIGSAIGSIVGALPKVGAFLSSEEKKTDKSAPSVSVLDAVRDMRVEEWRYKDGEGDGGGQRHIGPYAEDFANATGLGDGKTISVIDAIGVSLGAVQELADKVDDLASRVGGNPGPQQGSNRSRAVSIAAA